MSDLATVAKEAGLAVRSAGQHRVEGLENIDDKELSIGSIILVQPGHVELVNKGIAAGSLLNSATESKIEDGTFLPVFMTKYWALYDNSGNKPKFVTSSPNENDVKFKGKLRKEDLTDAMYKQKVKAEVIPVIFVAALMNGEPVKIAFKKGAGYYAGKDLYTLIVKGGGQIWANKYKLGSKLVPAKGDIPAYFALTVSKVGPATEDEKKMGALLGESFQAKKEAEIQKDASIDEPPF